MDAANRFYFRTNFGACGGSKEKSTSSPDYELENVSFPLKEKVSLKMMSQSAPLAPNDPNDKLIFQRLEEETNLHIDWTNYSSDFAEKEIWISLVRFTRCHLQRRCR